MRHQTGGRAHNVSAWERPELSRLLSVALAASMLAAFTGLSIWEMWHDSVTIDERVYLPAGYVYWTQRDFSLNPEHPPLVKLLASIPLLFTLAPKFPFSDNDSQPAGSGGRQSAAERQMVFGSQFLYSQDADRIMFLGRLPIISLGVLLGIFIFWWSREMHGNVGPALLSLLLFTLEPTLLAHSHYVTTDVALACFGVMAMFFLFKFHRNAKLADLAWASFGLGLALASKFSAIFLLPVFYFLMVIKWPSNQRQIANLPWNSSVGRRSLTVLGSVFLVALTIQSSYLFSQDPMLYVKGLTAVNINELPQSVLSYVHGDFYPGGVWWYHLYVVLLKLPLPTLLVIFIAALATRRKHEDRGVGAIFALLPAAVLGLATCALANNLGARYMIPVVVFLIVFAGRGWFVLAQKANLRLAGGILALWLAGSVLRVSPHYVSYFNELIGGPENAANYLDDSNVDWGQDFFRLMTFLKARHIQQAVLSYWGPTPSEYYAKQFGVRFAPWTYELAGSTNPPPGLYAISVNQLVGIKREQLWLNRPLDPKLDWLKRFQPSARIGYSIYIYEFPEAATR